MSVAGTPSTDPWVIVPREKIRYEEQFKALKPLNGIVTGEQAKGFFLQSQLPPLVLGQIWGLADTDADGKMDVNEFSIACKLINLKLRGFEIPKVLPPNLLVSLKGQSPPSIPPLPNASLINAPPRPEPPKVPAQPAMAPVSTSLIGQPAVVPTGIVPPMQSMPQMPMGMMGQQIASVAPNVAPVGMGVVPPLIPNQPVGMMSAPPIIPAAPLTNQPIGMQPIIPPMGMGAPLIPPAPITTQPMGMVSGAPIIPAAPIIPTSRNSPLGAPMGMGAAPTGMIAPPAGMVPPTAMGTPVGAVTGTPMGTGVGVPAPGPGATSTPRTSIDRASVDLPQLEWSVPHQTKLKYTQIFNTTDRTRSGFLTGPQARNVMVQTKLPQGILAQIWALSDMDSDGRLGCEEFVLAMHLCEQASLGNPPPATLPPDLIPPSFRRTARTVSRTASISSQGSGQPDVDLTLISQNSFEDKRKENFEKGQAELDRRRKTLLDQQRKEAEERERKEREEIEKREKARIEAERKRVEELEKQMREQQERERQMEEDRKRQAEQRETARKEMERQRQLEWEKQRLQELQQQRQREQENVLKLKAKSQSLTIELTGLNDQVKELSQKICDTRVGVSNVKSTIDGMRSKRDTSMQDMAQLKNKVKEQNAKLLQLSQERIKMEAKNKMNTHMNDKQSEQAKQAYENKEITIKNLKEKIEDMQSEIDNKMSDIENNNSQLTDLKGQLSQLLGDCEDLYAVYEQKKNTVLEMKGTKTNTTQFSSAWGNDTSWSAAETQEAEWPVENWSSAAAETVAPQGTVKYRALYEFVARNNDEISFQPGDIINVPAEQTGEPGWLAGEIRGHTGWFPESYVEPVDGANVRGAAIEETSTTTNYIEDIESKRLEGIAEVPETIPEPEPVAPVAVEAAVEPEMSPENYVASYPYQSVEQGDLTFEAGEFITVIKKEGDWWTGKIGERCGIFPSNYVQKIDTTTTTTASTVDVVTAAVVTQQQETESRVIDDSADLNQMDNEVSQINENKEPEKPDFAALMNQQQTMKAGKKPEIASVIAPYQATSNEQLSLERGQLIMIRKKTDSGWWEGELQAKGRKRQVGWFPASYVKVLNSSGRTSGRTTPVSSTRMQQEVVIDKVVALYPYTAANPDELSFLKDDIISVTAREEQAWWRGELNGVSGLFPSNYVTPLQQSDEILPTVNKKRKDCIEELIHTEKTYIEDMKTVHRVFELPLIESNVVSKKNLNVIFVNWQDILTCNKEFLRDLLKREQSGDDVFGDIICKHLPQMTAYVNFCQKQLESARLLQNLNDNSQAFRDVVRKCQSNPETKGLPLSSFLLKPMQRITRYPLLIEKILNNTPDNHRDYIYLKEAMVIADSFLKKVNENVRQKEDFDRLEWLQANIQNDLNLIFKGNTNKLGARKLQHFGLFTKLKSGKELLGFLLNDFLLLVQPNKAITTQFMFQRNSNMSYKMYKQPMMIDDLEILRVSPESVENGTDINRILKLQDNKIIVTLLTPSVNDCTLWVKKIEAAKEMYEKVVSLTKPRPKIKATDMNTCGRLLVNVQRGKHFQNTGKSFIQNVYCQLSMSGNTQNTNVAMDSLNGNVMHNGIPQPPMLIWNYTTQFPIKDIDNDVLVITVFEMCPFAPDEFLGMTEIKLRHLHREFQERKINGPIKKKLILHQVESGELECKFDMQLFS